MIAEKINGKTQNSTSNAWIDHLMFTKEMSSLRSNFLHLCQVITGRNMEKSELLLWNSFFTFKVVKCISSVFNLLQGFIFPDFFFQILSMSKCFKPNHWATCTKSHHGAMVNIQILMLFGTHGPWGVESVLSRQRVDAILSCRDIWKWINVCNPITVQWRRGSHNELPVS